MTIKKYFMLALLGPVLLSITAESLAINVGDVAPNVVGRKIDDSLFTLSRVEKKPKVVNFFWVKCIPCKKEIPLLAEKEKQYPNVEFIVVHAESNAETGSNYELKDVQAFVQALSASPETVVLGSPMIKQQYRIKGFPASVLLSADNKVEAYIEGFNDKTVQRLTAWLKQQK